MAPVLRGHGRRRHGPLLSVARASLWADAVFHVLAHVDVPYPSSAFSAPYRSWAEEKLGNAGARPLTEDIGVLAQAPEEAFARMQALAWVFRSADAVRRATDRELRGAIVDDQAARGIALAAGPIAEVLRAAAELEMSWLEELRGSEPWTEELDLPPLAHALDEITAAAPMLAECTVEMTPALGLRGRVLNRHIFVGVPGIAGANAEHIAWQAAHEATVTSLPTTDQADLERFALGLLRSRARRAGLADRHAHWLAHLDLRALGPIPDVEDAT